MQCGVPRGSLSDEILENRPVVLINEYSVEGSCGTTIVLIEELNILDADPCKIFGDPADYDALQLDSVSPLTAGAVSEMAQSPEGKTIIQPAWPLIVVQVLQTKAVGQGLRRVSESCKVPCRFFFVTFIHSLCLFR